MSAPTIILPQAWKLFTTMAKSFILAGPYVTVFALFVNSLDSPITNLTKPMVMTSLMNKFNEMYSMIELLDEVPADCLAAIERADVLGDEFVLVACFTLFGDGLTFGAFLSKCKVITVLSRQILGHDLAKEANDIAAMAKAAGEYVSLRLYRKLKHLGIANAAAAIKALYEQEPTRSSQLPNRCHHDFLWHWNEQWPLGCSVGTAHLCRLGQTSVMPKTWAAE